jgi:arabinofuranosyltransferase
MLKGRFLFIFLYIGAIATLSWYVTGQSWIGIDDANIYLVYMRNLAYGHGFVYNVGGEHVEGFTSLLWTLVGAFFYLFTENPEIILWWTNVLLVSYTCYRVTRYIDGPQENRIKIHSVFFLFLIGFTPGFMEWNVTTLMDTGLWTFLLTGTALHVLQRDQTTISDNTYYLKFSGWLVLLLLCRPESMLWVPLFLAIVLLKEYQAVGLIKAAFGRIAIPAAVSLSFLTALILWRIWYFGYPLPNTYYAKVSSDWIHNLHAGRIYLIRSLRELPIFIVLVLLCLYSIISSRISRMFRSGSEFILLVILTAGAMIPLLTGGDHFALYRFIVPFFPSAFLLVAFYARKYIKSSFWLFLIGLILFLSNRYNLLALLCGRTHPLKHDWQYAVQGRAQSVFLNEFFENTDLPAQGVLAAGGAAYAYPGKTIDLLGLNNTQMAHAGTLRNSKKLKNHDSFSKPVFFELAPDLLWYPAPYRPGVIDTTSRMKIDTNSFYAQTFDQIHLDPRFRKSYGLYLLRNRKTGVPLRAFIKMKYIQSLDTGRFFIKTHKYE